MAFYLPAVMLELCGDIFSNNFLIALGEFNVFILKVL